MPEKRLDVTAVGTLAVDYYALVDSIPGAETKTRATGYEIHPGGVAGNVLTQTARLGLRSGWIGKVGDDPTGRILIDSFLDEGVDTTHTEIIKDRNSMFTWITVDAKGDRSIIMFPNVLTEITPEEISGRHREYIQNSKVLQIEACLLPLNIMIAAAEAAKDSDTIVVFDLDVTPTEIVSSGMGSEKELYRLLELTDFLIPCKSAISELMPSGDIPKSAHDLLKFGPSLVAVTLGADGCVVSDSRNTLIVPGFKINPVDTTGAGDAFHGGMIYSVINKMNPEDSGRFANACGASCCRHIGARAMGTLSEIENFIKEKSGT